MNTTQPVIDIRDFERKYLKIFCEKHITEAFEFLDDFNHEEAKSLSGDAKTLIDFLMKHQPQGLHMPAERWLKSSFEGLNSSFEACLLSYPFNEREIYENSSELRARKEWIYEVFYKIHFNEIEQSKHNFIEYEREYEDCSSKDELKDKCYKLWRQGYEYGDKYLKRLEELYSKYTKKNNSSSVIPHLGDNTKNILSKGSFQILKKYFRINGIKKDDLCFQNHSDLSIESKKIPYDKVKSIVSSIEKSATKNKTAINAYAFYWLNKQNGATLYSAATKHILEPVSLGTKAERRLIERFYYEFKKSGF